MVDRARLELSPVRTSRGILPISVLGLVLLSAAQDRAAATVEDADRTGKTCADCHVREAGGGPLTDYGAAYQLTGRTFPVPERAIARVEFGRTAAGRFADLLFGALHLIAAVVWLGSIFFIHFFVGARSLTSGLPKRERILGWTCIALISPLKKALFRRLPGAGGRTPAGRPDGGASRSEAAEDRQPG